LIWAMGCAQLLSAASFPIGVLLAAEKRGPEFFWTGLASAGSIFVAATVLAAVYGVLGAAWGIAIGTAVGAAALAILAAREAS
jgi:hypothetical protein